MVLFYLPNTHYTCICLVLELCGTKKKQEDEKKLMLKFFLLSLQFFYIITASPFPFLVSVYSVCGGVDDDRNDEKPFLLILSLLLLLLSLPLGSYLFAKK